MARRPARPRTPKSPPQPAVSRQAASLAAVRMVILLGVLIMGGVGWFVSRRAGAPGAPRPNLEAFRWVAIAAWIMGLGGVLAVRLAWQRARDAGSRRRLSVVGWALGELPALAGAAYLWATGDPRRYAAGLIFLLLTFYAFTAPLERR